MQAWASEAEAKAKLATEGETAAAERMRQLEQQLTEVQSSLEFAEVGQQVRWVDSLTALLCSR